MTEPVRLDRADAVRFTDVVRVLAFSGGLL